MKQIKLNIQDDKVEVVLGILNNLKDGLISSIQSETNILPTTKYQPKQNKIIQNENIEERISLLHSDTTSYYLKESTVEEDKVIEYTNKGKQFSLPLTISTLDQIFNFVYNHLCGIQTLHNVFLCF